ncbi:MAG: 7TM-DISM domain-containing protein [Desulfomicrobium escambiense]|nr:7TM-DISM domain-containing protein [Desulfomicrobium escambiense]
MGHFRRALLSVCLILATLSVAGCDFQRRTPPRAVKGVLDLRSWTSPGRAGRALRGVRVPPGAARRPRPDRPGVPQRSLREPAGLLERMRVDGETLAGEGVATYRLTVLVAPSRVPLALQVREVSTAYRLFVDGELLAAAGEAGTTAETSVPEYLPQVAGFKPASGRFDILLQVSNFHHRRGGPWDLITPRAGSADPPSCTSASASFDFFLLGGIFIMAVYHLSLFLARRKFRPTLYLRDLLPSGRRCGCSPPTSATWSSSLPALDWALLVKLEYLSFYLAVPVFGLFLQSLFPQLPRRLLRRSWSIGLGFSGGRARRRRSGVFSHTPARLRSLHPGPDRLHLPGCCCRTRSSGSSRPSCSSSGCWSCVWRCVNDILHVERVIRHRILRPVRPVRSSSSPRRFCLSFRLMKAFTLVETRSVELRDTLESLQAGGARPHPRRGGAARKRGEIPHHSEQHPGRLLRGRPERQHDVLQRFPVRDHRLFPGRADRDEQPPVHAGGGLQAGLRDLPARVQHRGGHQGVRLGGHHQGRRPRKSWRPP